MLLTVRDIVDTKENGLFFHNDLLHEYAFDGTDLHNSAIYGQRKARKEGEAIGTRVTSSKLVPI